MVHAYWFKPKKYGYGASPSTWEGWALTAAYCLIVWACAAGIATHVHLASVIVPCAIVAAAATIALVVVAMKKTEGRWGWNAGSKQISGKND
jgi:hypothetical protein